MPPVDSVEPLACLSVHAVGDATGAVVRGLSLLTEVREPGNQILAPTGTGFHKLDEINHAPDYFRWGGVLDFTGALFGQRHVQGKDVDKELLERIVAVDDILGNLPTFVGEGDDLIGGVIDQTPLRQGPERLGDRSTAYGQAGGNIFASGHLFLGDDMVDSLDVVLKAGA